MKKKIVITWDEAGFKLEVDDKIFETDYCGFMNEDDISVVKDLLEYLGYEVELKETYFD